MSYPFGFNTANFVPHEYNTLFLAFIECNLKGRWATPSSSGAGGNLSHPRQVEPWQVYRALREPDCEIHIIEPDGLRRIFAIKADSFVYVGPSMIQFEKSAIVEEHSVDQEAQQGNRNTREML